MEDHLNTNIWAETLALLEKDLNKQSFELWFKPTRLVAINNETVTLEVPNKFFRDWLSDHYLNLIDKTLEQVAHRKMKILWSISSQDYSPELKGKRPEPSFKESSAIIDQLNRKYTFDSFVVGNSNRFAHAASLAVAEAPAKAYNPFFIYGGVGLGKTHLLQAIGHFVREQNPNAKVVYVSSEKFMNEMITSISYGKMIEFRNKFRGVDILLVDDIQFLAGKESTQEEFFHTFNALYDAHRQIVISSDSHPKEIPTLEERLRSRFQWGLITDIQPPDLETRIAILRKKAEMEGLYLPNEVTLFLADKIKSNIRELEGSLTRIVAFASLTGREISLDLTMEVLRDSIPEEKPKLITIELIQKIVAQYFNLRSADMKAKKRTRTIAFPRQVAMYLARELTEASLPEIGENFGGRDHTTVMHAYEKIKRRIAEDTQFQKEMNQLISILKEAG